MLHYCRDAFGTFDCIWDLNAFDPINKGDKQRWSALLYIKMLSLSCRHYYFELQLCLMFDTVLLCSLSEEF